MPMVAVRHSTRCAPPRSVSTISTATRTAWSSGAGRRSWWWPSPRGEAADTTRPGGRRCRQGGGAGPHMAAVRRWVRGGELPIVADEARRAVGDLSSDEVLARLHFRVGAQARRRGDDVTARRHFALAGELAPNDFTIRRATMP